MKLTPYLLLVAVGAANAAPQGFLSELASAFGFGDEPTSTTHARTLGHPTTTNPGPTASLISIPPPAIVSTAPVTSFSSPSPSPTPTDTDTDSDSDSSTITSTSSTSTTDTNTTSTTPPSTTSPTTTASPTTAQPVASATSTPAPASSQSHVSPAGLAVAIILTLAVVAVVIWLVFRYHPGLRAWWDEREEKRMKERSYRDAIDGPFARGRGNGVRNQALGSRKSVLASFFAPRTVNLGEGKEIRRKPVNWGVSSPPLPETDKMDMTTVHHSGSGSEKVALANMAAPMARSESVVSSLSYNSSSARSSPGIVQKELPRVPPMPLVPVPVHHRSHRSPRSPASPDASGGGVGRVGSPMAPVELDSQPQSQHQTQHQTQSRDRDKLRDRDRDRDRKPKGVVGGSKANGQKSIGGEEERGDGTGAGTGGGGGGVHRILSRKSIFELA